MVLNIKKQDCCGCGVCKNICPNQCIEMVYDKEFFKYPVIDNSVCTNCRACEKICPVISVPKSKNNIQQNVFAAWNNNPNIRNISTSGGIISALSEKILAEGGCVVGAYYKNDFTVAHMIGNSINDINLLRQSKYVQSEMDMVYKEIKTKLSMKKKVLFCGAPCHCAALSNYINNDDKNLYIVDFVCRGVISPGVFKEYLHNLEKKYKGKVIKVQFKNKDRGWNNFCTKIWFDNNKEYIRDRYHDPYMVSYLRYSVSLRPSCYECKFKGTKRYSDITVGDFWGIGKKDPSLDEDKGTSLVIVNTQKGNDLFSSISNLIHITKCDYNDIPEGNMCLNKSPKKGEYRDLFFKDLGKKSFNYIYTRYVLKRKLHTLFSLFYK